LTNRTWLASQIASCTHFERGGDGVCDTVISAQSLPHGLRRMPEPWTGRRRLDRAPILFITSNPNTKPGKVPNQSEVPLPDRLLDFYESYFERHPDSIKTVPTWRRMRIWADQLCRNPSADVNFALTDAVHCASRKQVGVREALERCATLYLRQVVEAGVARLVVCCGSAAARGFNIATDGRVALG
jgi:hypothetical protein